MYKSGGPVISRKAMNTSIRLFRSRTALNTSRRILAKSINQSHVCVNSLKMNNANLAKRVAELQLELSQQRAIAQEAVSESNRLQLEISRLRAMLEVRGQLKDELLHLREEMNPVVESVMNMMSIINRMGQLITPETNLSDTASFLLAGGMSFLANQTLGRSAIKHAATPPQSHTSDSLRQQPQSHPQQQELLLHLEDYPHVVSGQRQSLGRRQQDDNPPPVAQRRNQPQQPTLTTVSQGTHTRPIATTLPELVQESPNPTRLPTEDDLSGKQEKDRLSQTASHNPFPQTCIAQPPATSPVFSAEVTPLALTCSPSPAASENSLFDDLSQPVGPASEPNNRPVQPPASPQGQTPSQLDRQPPAKVFASPPAPPAKSRPHRQTRTKSKPIVDVESSQLSFLAADSQPPPTRRMSKANSKRKRLVCGDDDQDDIQDDSDVDYTPTAWSRRRKTGPGRKASSEQAPPRQGQGGEAPRVVQGGYDRRTGQLVFRTDAKLAPAAAPSLAKSKSNRRGTKASAATAVRSKDMGDREASQSDKPKCVYDLSANLTINTSVLPASLNELRQQQLNRVADEKPGQDWVKSTGDINVLPYRSSVVLCPIDVQKLTKRVTPSPKSTKVPKRHRRRLIVDLDSENEEPVVEVEENKKKTTTKTKKQQPRRARPLTLR